MNAVAQRKVRSSLLSASRTTTDYVSINEATKLASVSRRTIYNWLVKGTLDYCVLPSGMKRIRVSSLLRVVETYE